MKTVEFFGCWTVLNHDILDMYHWVTTGMSHADKIGKGGRRTLGHHLHGTVRKIFYVSMHPGRLSAI